jgi:hypothetical protein
MDSIPALNDCELTKMDDEGFMLSGHESAQHLQDTGPRQTWWCRPVPEQDTGAAGSAIG